MNGRQFIATVIAIVATCIGVLILAAVLTPAVEPPIKLDAREWRCERYAPVTTDCVLYAKVRDVHARDRD